MNISALVRRGWCTGIPVTSQILGEHNPENQPLPGVPTAGACDGARKGDGCGGWGVAIRLADGRLLERSGAEPDTTNNRQELRAAIEALQLLAQLPAWQGLELACDSRYVIDNLARSVPRWHRNGWRAATGEPVKNRDLWELLEAAAASAPWVRLVWVRGHNGHALNETADRLASAAAEALQLEQAAALIAAPSKQASEPVPGTPSGLLPQDWAELQASAIAADVAAANVASFGPGTDRHWELERAELVGHARHRIQTGSTAGNGHPQAPDGGGLLLPQVPERCWLAIADRQGLPRPDAAALAAGFWPWALATPGRASLRVRQPPAARWA